MILFAVPLGLVGVVPMLYLTGTAINVQSLLGVIFMVGIVVSNTVLLTDFAQNLRRHEGLTPDRGDPQGGVDPRAAGGDDGPGGVLRAGPDGAGAGAAAARPTRAAGRAVIGGSAGGAGDDAVRGAVALLAGGPG